MQDYFNRIIKDSNIVFVYIAIILLSFYALSTCEDYRQIFLILIFIIVVIIYYYNYTMVTFIKENASTQLFQKNQKTVTDIEFVIPEVFQLHKNPKSIKYINRNPKVINIMNDISFIKIYDEASYEMIVILCEYFFKVYYNILDEKYNCNQYANILYDTRKELLNNMSQLYFAVPQFSKSTDGNLWKKIDVNKRKLQAITYRCLKIISHYGKKTCNLQFDYKGPKPNDTFVSYKHRLF